MNKIKLFLTDVDGTLTDGGMYYSAEGDVMKRFYVRDGMGMKLLQQSGVRIGIITSETTPVVEARAKKLGVDYLCQGVRFDGKLSVVKKICSELGITMQQVAYIGDDVNDIDLLSAVGMAACPQDACNEVLALPHIHIMNHAGGHGAVREWADMTREI
ncbi:MAG: HAD-IIIA family hydrolase [Paludibacteraceae bacterium]|nr:HAD-IIIA family hydrolase [Paludibacteraceae bacterium]